MAMNSTLSRHARSIARELTMPWEKVSNTAFNSIAGECAVAPVVSLR